MQSLYPLFVERAAKWPGNIAIATPGKADTSYADLISSTDAVRRQLATFGIKRGKRVGLVVPTRDAMAGAYLAVMAGATAAPISAKVTPDELEFDIKDFRLDFVIMEEGLTALSERAATLGTKVIKLKPDVAHAGKFTLSGNVVAPGAEPQLAEVDDIAVVFHTSGTTARPKIVPRAHMFHARRYAGDAKSEILFDPGDRIVNAMPLHHTQGLTAELLTGMMGGCSVAMVDFNPREFISVLEKYRPAKFTLVPSMHQMVLDQLPEGRKLPLDLGLRYVQTSSAKLPAQLRALMESVYGVPVYESFGATEVISMVVGNWRGDGIPKGSVGKRSHPGVVIQDAAGNVLAAGQTGEICIDTSHTIAGYENNPEANAVAFRNGYYHTGDEGYLDADEYLYIVGRVSESINRGGEKIAPAEVDDVLLKHPAIHKAAAFGVPDKKFGQEIWAAVVLKQGSALEAGQLRAFASRSLSFPKVPKRVIVVDDLPFNEIGKVLRRQLTQTYGAR